MAPKESVCDSCNWEARQSVCPWVDEYLHVIQQRSKLKDAFG